MLTNAYFTLARRVWIQAPKMKTERRIQSHGQSTGSFSTDTRRITLPGNSVNGLASMSSATTLGLTSRTGAWLGRAATFTPPAQRPKNVAGDSITRSHVSRRKTSGRHFADAVHRRGGRTPKDVRYAMETRSRDAHLLYNVTHFTRVAVHIAQA